MCRCATSAYAPHRETGAERTLEIVGVFRRQRGVLALSRRRAVRTRTVSQMPARIAGGGRIHMRHVGGSADECFLHPFRRQPHVLGGINCGHSPAGLRYDAVDVGFREARRRKAHSRRLCLQLQARAAWEIADLIRFGDADDADRIRIKRITKTSGCPYRRKRRPAPATQRCARLPARQSASISVVLRCVQSRRALRGRSRRRAR